MKRYVLAAATVAVATLSLASAASAEWRNNGDDEWRRGGRHTEHRDRDDGNWDRDRDRRHSDRGDDDWRRDRWRHDHGWRRDHGWRHDRWREGYWGGPRIVIRPGYDDDYCFIKKIVRYDDWGNAYIKRVRVCR